MARKLASFPSVFAKITRKAVEEMARVGPGGPPLFTIPCGGKNTAISLQMQLRTYWKAVREAELAGLAESTGLGDVAAQVSNLACRYTTDRLGVEIVHRNQMATAKVLASALGALEESLAAMDESAGGAGRALQARVEGERTPRADPMTSALESAFPDKARG